MAKDKYSAIWLSHSSIGDYLKCPRAYYLNNIYKDPKTGHKITLMEPSLALGLAVHDVVECISLIPKDERFKVSLIERYEHSWEKVNGKLGGFTDLETEVRYKKRGGDMIRRLINNPGPLRNKAVKINMNLPYYWLSEPDNFILCGKIDWLEYLPETDSVHIIDFKTGKQDEKPDSLQLPIYFLLVQNCQKRKITKASYWYLERNDKPTSVTQPDVEKTFQKLLKIAKKIKISRQLSHFKCPLDGCRFCLPLEAIINEKAEFVGVNDFNQDIYIMPDWETAKDSSMIL